MVVGELTQERDLIIIGGGPGGYTAAIRAAQLGKEVTLIEKEKLGGICLNRGCIPSKVISHVSNKFNDINQSPELGFKIENCSFDFSKTVEYKHKIITDLRKGIEALCKENHIEVIQGTASFLSADRIGVENGDQFDIYTCNSAIISTGCSTKNHELYDHKHVLDSRSLYELQEIPEQLILFGNDYIALEAAFSYQSLGSEVHLVIENDIFPGLDFAINKELFRQLKKAKIKLHKNLSFSSVELNKTHLSVAFDLKHGDKVTMEASYLYIQSPFRANIGELGIDRLGITCDEHGYIEIDKECRTSIPTIWAVGDVTGGKQLAVKAIRQGKVAAEAISGIPSEWSEAFIPTIIHSKPPIATIGLTEEEAKDQGYAVRTGQFNQARNGFAAITGNRDGFSKVVSNAENDVILGIHLYGSNAIELISTGILALEMAAREEDIKFPLFPHPSNNEGLLEAVEALVNQAIHQVPKKSKITSS
ncbi:dihydrolipoyl dehydrogenase [Peribacillus cavernae]|uniref:Dihydrolipoyl dehydrogenase n=1 Tax=Peribacillus cavernae TaxID=1674310 RepID=A0A3S0VF84_9BACI|nr:dihydrolipoyl dehydrogenase [Peribacillus cavernae]MDQ0218734.1 dihydrolipoamide dehydrogenase [Peribacillus cavernae]RUQ30947.1 dihydrolipoyl dehydrogenase [Peribacillus cavernae]